MSAMVTEVMNDMRGHYNVACITAEHDALNADEHKQANASSDASGSSASHQGVLRRLLSFIISGVAPAACRSSDAAMT